MSFVSGVKMPEHDAFTSTVKQAAKEEKTAAALTSPKESQLVLLYWLSTKTVLPQIAFTARMQRVMQRSAV